MDRRLADPRGGVETLRGPRRRHPDVDDAASGSAVATNSMSPSASPAWPTTSIPAATSALASASRNRTHRRRGLRAGISARTVCLPPGSLCDASGPPTAATRSSSPRRPEPAAGFAPPMPSSVTSTVRTPSLSPIPRVAALALAYFATFVNASAATK